ncbi:biosynthetic-type acetolactate synthase large subunit [Leptospira idonii]|uniref:Acetolactate synthase n=1 Tax=Leptospira idonii TaxID=1193500 RepID=A0A4R9M4M5_9LEPT|nr:biosynthetic-type acetolactate synthase large subunit [Leptospira idonii]TGN20677.1 biosynthetic-type acetolactate synthase large subunit [Leptospira idonii]
MQSYTQITVADYCIRFFESKGITQIPGIPGGTILPMYHALAKSKIRHILARHEQGAGFIAQGMARTSRKPRPFFISSGPGVANAITAVADAQRDSVPLIAISGQVPRELLGTDAFQELDTLSIVKNITKKAYLVLNANSVPEILEEAYRISMEGKQGPVWIDFPKDIQNSYVDLPLSKQIEAGIKINGNGADVLSSQTFPLEERILTESLRLIEESKKPLLYVGGGAKPERIYPLIRKFAEEFQVPSVSTLMGLGIFQESDELYLGMMGMHGSTSANDALGECDLLIALGVRFDDRATGNIKTFCPNAKVIHIEIDPREIGKNKKADLFWNGDLEIYLSSLLNETKRISKERWISRSTPNEEHQRPIPGLMRSIAKYANNKSYVLTDVGQHQMWVAQHYPFPHPGTWITSGGQGTMGFGLPASIGVALEHPEATILCFTGDGSIMMNLQELATLREQNLNVKIILMNNGHLGLVRQQQEMFYQNQRSGSVFEYQPDFRKLSESFGLSYERRNIAGEFSFLEEWMRTPGPSLLEIEIPSQEGVFPFVPAGKSNQEYLLTSSTGIH